MPLEERNNLTRISAGTSAEIPAEPSQQTVIKPTEFVDLPSEGRFYPENHPLHNKTSIEIRYMTARDEDILTSKTLIKKGVVIDRLLESLIIDKSITIDSLLIGDKNAIILAARLTGYGSDYETNIVCPQCSEKVQYVFDLNEIENKFVTNEMLTNLQIEYQEQTQTFKFKLPKSNSIVECRLLYSSDEHAISQMLENKKKLQLETNVTDSLKQCIISINDVSDKMKLNKLIDELPSVDSRIFRKIYALITPNINLQRPFKCSNCEFEDLTEMPLSAGFFWPDR